MKNPFRNYPSVYYQIAGIFFLSQYCFLFGINFTYSDSFEVNASGVSYSSIFISLILSTLSIASGWIVNTIKDFIPGIKLGASLLLVGTLIAQWGGNSVPTYFISKFLLNLGGGVIVIFCIYHVAILFSVANDWKDNAFMILLLGGSIFTSLLFQVQGIALNSIATNLDGEAYFLLVKILNLIALIILLYLIFNLKHLGFKIEEGPIEEGPIEEGPIEEETLEDYNQENSFVKKIMIGLVLLSGIFFFITYNLAELDLFKSENLLLDSSLESLIDLFGGNQNFYFSRWIPLLIFTIIGVSLIYFSKNISTHFFKIRIISYALILLVIFKIIAQYNGNSALITLIELSIPYFFFALILPILISIMTHINLDKNLGIWLGLLFAVPEILEEIQYQLEYEHLGLLFPNLLQYLSYIAVILLLLFLVVLKENRDFLEKKLNLNESNQADDNEDEIDILEHFVDG